MFHSFFSFSTWKRKHFYLGTCAILSIVLLRFTWQLYDLKVIVGGGVGGGNNPNPSWLVAIMCPASHLSRRMIIRATWQEMYKNEHITIKFVLGHPDPLWKNTLAFENKSYGDLIVLDSVPDEAYAANTVKSIEFFRHVLQTTELRDFHFVSKIDDDSFLSAKAFWNAYLLPLAEKSGVATSSEHVIIGRKLQKDVTFPGGQFYTMTRNTLAPLVTLQDRFRITNRDEDWLVGTLLAKGEIPWTLIELENPVAFDYDANDSVNETSAWAKDEASQNLWSHAVGPKAINPHKMKTDEDYLRVATCFDENGVMSPE